MVSMNENERVPRARSLVARHVPALAAVCLVVTLSSLAACGQKGPLFLPAPALAASAPAPAASR